MPSLIIPSPIIPSLIITSLIIPTLIISSLIMPSLIIPSLRLLNYECVWPATLARHRPCPFEQRLLQRASHSALTNFIRSTCTLCSRSSCATNFFLCAILLIFYVLFNHHSSFVFFHHLFLHSSNIFGVRFYIFSIFLLCALQLFFSSL